jgi:FAD:protein FMN transferase
MSVQDSVERRYPTRREFLGLGLGAFVLASTAGLLRRPETVVRRSIPAMGTTAEIVVVHGDRRYARGALESALQQIRAVETTMTRFRDGSDIGRVNLHASSVPVVVGAATAAVLAESLRWAAASGGRFDPALLRMTALWDVGSRKAPPASVEVSRLAGLQLHRQVELGKRGGEHVVLLHAPEIGIDLGGIAKGHAVDRAVEALRAWGISNALVTAGGDLYALGHSPEGDPWQIGIQSPFDDSGLAATLPLVDSAIATSGDYHRYFEYGGRRYHHLLDPRTAEPHRAPVHSITVAASSCMTADAAATAIFGCSLAEAHHLLAVAAPDARLVHRI